MKGAIGNAFILNIVITFITIFLLLVVGSMAYTKAYKVKNYLLTEITKYLEYNHSEEGYNNFLDIRSGKEFDNIVNPYLAKAGYSISNTEYTCPDKKDIGYQIRRNTKVGSYDYCIYAKYRNPDYSGAYYNYSITYMVLVYMKFDLPVVGNFIRIPITGETKTFVEMR